MKQKYIELLKNKKILITGSTGKIGKYISKVLSNNKVDLILIDYDKKKLINQKKDLSKYRNKVRVYQCNFLDSNEKKVLFSLIKKNHKYIDTIINNAAFVG